MVREMIAPCDHELPIFARIGVGDRGDARRRDRQARIEQQRAMQLAFGRTCLGRRRNLRPRQIGLEELVSNGEPAVGVAIEQMVPGSEPEVARLLQRRSPSAGAGGSILPV
jgi:hypothetical protein